MRSNTFSEQQWHKPPGSFDLQTWHGTPLKHIHVDVLSPRTSFPAGTA